jgi:hypothetical protein
MMAETQTDTEPAKEVKKVITPAGPPLIAASEVNDQLGLNQVLFGFSGVGKTTLAATAQDSELGKDVVFVDIAHGTRSISDRDDILMYQPTGFEGILSFPDWLRNVKGHYIREKDGREFNFRTVVVDTLSETYNWALRKVMANSPPEQMPQFQDYGGANELVGEVVRKYRALAVDLGWNVIFTVEAKEERDDSTGAMLIRMALTPGATRNAYQIIDSVGYYSVERTGAGKDAREKRVLLLHATARLQAKHRQPRTGPQLATRLEEPTMDTLLQHARAQRQEKESK